MAKPAASLFNEYCLHTFKEPPRFTVSDTPDDPERPFTAVAEVAGVVRGTGKGRSKKIARQMAGAWMGMGMGMPRLATSMMPEPTITIHGVLALDMQSRRPSNGCCPRCMGATQGQATRCGSQ
jgi:hypothetical protein